MTTYTTVWWRWLFFHWCIWTSDKKMDGWMDVVDQQQMLYSVLNVKEDEISLPWQITECHLGCLSLRTFHLVKYLFILIILRSVVSLYHRDTSLVWRVVVSSLSCLLLWYICIWNCRYVKQQMWLLLQLWQQLLFSGLLLLQEPCLDQTRKNATTQNDLGSPVNWPG